MLMSNINEYVCFYIFFRNLSPRRSPASPGELCDPSKLFFVALSLGIPSSAQRDVAIAMKKEDKNSSRYVICIEVPSGSDWGSTKKNIAKVTVNFPKGLVTIRGRPSHQCSTVL